MYTTQTWHDSSMQIYLVGGAVRDKLLGRAAGDRDYVVVGALPEDLLALGYKPVGKDFPVFLHPDSSEEYALARTERKNGHGYHGFVFQADATVTLEQDLARRDLTINAIAEAADGALIDPFGGVRERSGARVAGGALCGALCAMGFHGGSADDGADATDGARRRGGSPGAGAGLGGDAQGAASGAALGIRAYAARVWRAGRVVPRDRCLVRRAATSRVPSGDRLRRASGAGAGSGGAAGAGGRPGRLLRAHPRPGQGADARR